MKKSISIPLLVVLSLYLVSCEKPLDPVLDNVYDRESRNFVAMADLTTSDISDVRAVEAQAGGRFMNDFGTQVTAKGVCWSTEPNPVVAGTCTNDGTGFGEFTSRMTNLLPETVYYVRAYATNSHGTKYGVQKEFTTAEGPLIEALSPDQIQATSVRLNGRITGDGYTPIQDQGFCVFIYDQPETVYCVSETTEKVISVVELLAGQLESSSVMHRSQQPTKNSSVLKNDGFEQSDDSDKLDIGAGNKPDIDSSGLMLDNGDNGIEEQSILPNGQSKSYSVTLSDLQPGIRYMHWAYAMSGEVAFTSDSRDLTTRDGLIVLTTNQVSSIGAYTAVSGGQISNDGGSPVTSRGVVWGTTSNPTISSNSGFTSNGTGTGGFTSNLTGLSAYTTYYVRAYATNSIGTVYGSQVSFETIFLSRDNLTTVVDVTNPATGRVWMDRNLGASRAATSSTDTQAYGDLYQWGRGADGHEKRNSQTTSTLSSSNHPSNGSFILAPNDPGDWRSPQNNNLWQGIDGIGIPCPVGYRMPTEAEWVTERLSWSNNNIAGAYGSPLKLPVAGRRLQSDGSLDFVGSSGVYWSSSVDDVNARIISFYSTGTDMFSSFRALGYSVRCIKDITFEVSTTDVTSITASSAVSGGNASNDGGASVTARGVVWGTSQNPTVATNAGITSNGTGTGNFTSTISGLSPITTYYVRAYATNSSGTVYGSQVQFTTSTDGRDNTTTVVDVTNPTTGRAWMDRNLGASRAAISSTDTQAYGDLYQWGRRADGHEKRNSTTTSILSSINQPNHGSFILALNSPNDWRSPQNNNLWQGVNGTNNPCPVGYRLPTEAELNAERLSWSSNNSTGAFASPLKLPMAGHRGWGNGSILNVGSNSYYWSSSVSGSFARYLHFESSSSSMFSHSRASGNSVRCLKDSVTPTTPNVTTTAVSSITTNSAASGGNVTNDGGATVSARGVVWSTSQNPTVASNAGITTNGTGTGIFSSNLSGLSPSTTYYVRAYATNSTGTSYGNQVQFTTTAGGTDGRDNITTVVDVTNPSTGRVWMDRNLGASRAATSSTDSQAYGDLYQWGRRADGHEKRSSTTTSTLSNTDQPGHGSFILTQNTPYDWRSPQNNNLWQGANGINNPCPVGYRLPTEGELNAERASWSTNTSAGAYASPLKLPVAGFRFYSLGSLGTVGSGGNYWSGSVSGSSARYLDFNSSSASMYSPNRAYGLSVRCLKD